MTQWQEKFEQKFIAKGYNLEMIPFIETEIIEKIINDLPKITKRIQDEEGFIPDDLLQLELRDKYLTK